MALSPDHPPDTLSADRFEAADADCFHCGLPNPAGFRDTLTVLNEERAFCCPGCRAVCEAIVGAGLEDYYVHRDKNAARADQATLPETLRQLSIYDHPRIQKSFVRETDDWKEASLILENIQCTACLWLNEQQLRRLDGVLDVQMD